MNLKVRFNNYLYKIICHNNKRMKLRTKYHNNFSKLINYKHNYTKNKNIINNWFLRVIYRWNKRLLNKSNSIKYNLMKYV